MAEQQAAPLVGVIGTYTRKEGHVDGQGAGLYWLYRNGTTALAYGDLINPSFVVISPDQRHVYAVEEIGPGAGASAGRVVALARRGERLKLLNRQPSGGFAPCHLAIDPQQRCVFAANYVGGVVAVYRLDPRGALLPPQTVQFSGRGPHPRQDNSHPHSVVLSPDARYAYVPDLGLDRIHCFRVDYAQGTLEPTAQRAVVTRPGAGPRHFTFHPRLPCAYLINELDNTITTYRWDAATGQLDSLQTISTLPADWTGENTTSDIHLSPDGSWLFGANRGHNSLAHYAVDPGSGTLSLRQFVPTKGSIPRNFAISPDGLHLYAANQNSDNIAVFRLTAATGAVELEKIIATPTPVCVQFFR